MTKTYDPNCITCRYTRPGGKTHREHRLDEIRASIRAENVSMGEIAELQSLAEWIDPGDVELLEWAGVPEFPEDDA